MEELMVSLLPWYQCAKPKPKHTNQLPNGSEYAAFTNQCAKFRHQEATEYTLFEKRGQKPYLYHQEKQLFPATSHFLKDT